MRFRFTSTIRLPLRSNTWFLPLESCRRKNSLVCPGFSFMISFSSVTIWSFSSSVRSEMVIRSMALSFTDCKYSMFCRRRSKN